MPRVRRVLETALYVGDLDRSLAFYRDVLGLVLISQGDRLIAMDAGGGTVLLLFRAGATSEGATFPGGWIPPHDAHGPAHFALAIDAEDLDPWRERLSTAGVEIESEVTWGRGGKSLYFRDPDGHSVELATPGVWSSY
jgi:catechol 2,3-dioxygenase-like lactoylglutathione lyase family enzyme